MYLKILENKPIFSQNFSSKFLEKLSLEMKETIIGPDEYLLNQGEKNDKIFFILNGTVNTYLKVNNSMTNFS